MDYTISTTVPMSYEETVTATRAALAEHGFGVLTEIDVRATMKTKLDLDVPAQVILGACRPQLAHAAMLVDASVATVLPCNVVVRALDETHTVVEAFDPDAMLGLAGESLRDIATEARARLVGALKTLDSAATVD